MSTGVQVHLPIFPLPDLTLFPHTVLPLHVFEARYRALVDDCLARDRRLAVVGLKPGYEDSYEGKPAVYAVAGAGRIIRTERLATGRFNIVLRGDCRIRIESEMPSDTLYRIVRATVLPDRGADGPAVSELGDRVKEACRRLLRAVHRSAPGMEEALAGATVPAALCDQVASAVIPSPALRQRLLEEVDVERRLRRLLRVLDALLARLSGDR